MVRVMIGLCHALPEIGASKVLSMLNQGGGKKADTFANQDGNVFLKISVNEVYPEAIIVYRDKSGFDDSRTSRISDVVKSNCLVSYRAGTRYNPEEAKFRAEDKDAVKALKARRQSVKSGKRGERKENMSPNSDHKKKRSIEDEGPEGRKGQPCVADGRAGAAVVDGAPKDAGGDNTVVMIHAPEDYSETGAIPKRSNPV